MSTRKSCGQFKESRPAGLVAKLWDAMCVTGNGYQRHSLRNTGEGIDRRADKLKSVDVIDKEGKPAVELHERQESKLERKARLKQIGKRFH